MEPIKPIEGNLPDPQGQASVLAEVMRDRYWQQRADRVANTVQARRESAGNKSSTENSKTLEPKVADLPNPMNTYAEFTVDSETNKVVVRIIDGNSGDLVRTIPPEELAREIARGKLVQTQIRRRNIQV